MTPMTLFFVAAMAVSTGSVVESGSGVASADRIAAEKLGDLVVEFKTNWTPEEIRATGERCRALGLRFRLDEVFDRKSGEVKAMYAPRLGDMLAAAREYADVYAGAGLFYETGGVLYYWQQPGVADAKVKIPPVTTFAEAEAYVSAELKRGIALAEKTGVPRPYANIEASFGFAPHLFKAGYDEVDLEVIYGPDQERCYAGVKTAAEVFGCGRFGVDMAMAWYGGVQHDALWDSRWRVSLKHAFMRGANPIYLEHGLLYFEDQGLSCGVDHPYTRAMRAGLAEIARYARENPRPEGLPCAAVAAIQGRNDGFIGGFQTHLYGQRTNEMFRLTCASDGWNIFDGLYRRRTWHDRNAWGDSDYSGNPPLGTADILPYDAPDSAWAKYKTVFFLGRNTMDDALYERLVRYVKRGGTLVMAASHLDVVDRPGAPFVPYNGGDWSRLAGVRVKGGKHWRLPHGIKFSANPAPGWRFDPIVPDWDPLYPDGGFDVLDAECESAKAFVVASDRFSEKTFDHLPPVAFFNRVGKGMTVLLASTDPPGARGVCGLYTHILDQALKATDAWPKVECSDRVRYAVYPDGTIYILNTEAHLRTEAIVRRSASVAAESFMLAPGELLRIPPCQFVGHNSGMEVSEDAAVVLADSVKLSCANPGGWRIEVTTRPAESGVGIVRVDMKSEVEAAPPKFSLRWFVPQTDVHHLWTCESTHYGIPWSEKMSSSLASWMPLYVFMDANDTSRFAFACSESRRKVVFTAPVSETKMGFNCAFDFFTMPEAPLKEYAVEIRFDARREFYGDVIGAAADWMCRAARVEPMMVPDAAFDAVYSTWYDFHQDVSAADVEKECARAASLGMKTVIVDDGWQIDLPLGNRPWNGYRLCGDWKPGRHFPDMAAHVRRIHEMGLRYMMWYSVPFIGKDSANFARFKGKYLPVECAGGHVLDPRFPEVREFVAKTYEDAVREWDIDGLKLDFIGRFALKDGVIDPAVAENYAGRDMKSIPLAVDAMLADAVRRLRAIKPEMLIEFRQPYVGPAIRRFGNMLRATDCPLSMVENRTRIARLRLTSGGTAVHSDMLEWRYDETAESAARCILNSIFGVVQYSMHLDRLPDDHAAMVAHWIRFAEEHRDALVKGAFRPRFPSNDYPILEGESEKERIIGVYQEKMVVDVGLADKSVYVLNGANATALTLDLCKPPSRIEVYDTYGAFKGSVPCKLGLTRLAVPVSGYVKIEWKNRNFRGPAKSL